MIVTGNGSPSDLTLPSDWRSAHIYLAGEHAGEAWGNEGDTLVRRVVAPFCDRWSADVSRHSFFFIRYADPEPHVRLRFKAPNIEMLDAGASLLADLLASFNREPTDASAPRPALLKWTDYEPEVARYGGPHAIAVAERVFSASTVLALSWLKEAPVTPSHRLRNGMIATIATLYTFEPNATKAGELLRHYRRWIEPSNQNGGALSEGVTSLVEQQRAETSKATSDLWAQLCMGSEIDPFITAYIDDLTACREELFQLFMGGALRSDRPAIQDWDQWLTKLMPSYLHMMSNRLGLTKAHEVYVAELCLTGTVFSDVEKSAGS